MAKRFVSTKIWDEDWFLDMPIEYRLFWFYLISSCDHAGIFKVNLRSFCGLNGVKIDPQKALVFLNEGKVRIREINNTTWFIEDFFVYQYGEVFNLNNRVHDSISRVYNTYGIKITSIRGLKDLKDRVKDKDKDKEKDRKSTKGGAGGKREPGGFFSKEQTVVVFADSSEQELTAEQIELVKKGELKPWDIYKQN